MINESEGKEGTSNLLLNAVSRRTLQSVVCVKMDSGMTVISKRAGTNCISDSGEMAILQNSFISIKGIFNNNSGAYAPLFFLYK